MADRIFADRGRAHEAAFSAEQHAQFNTIARRNRLLAVWAADLLGAKVMTPILAKSWPVISSRQAMPI